MKLPHLRSEQIKTQPDQTSALINKIIDRVNDPNLGGGGGGGGTSDFNELTNRPSYAGTTMTGSTNIPAVPTKTSQLNNDSGFVNTTDLTNAISTHNTSSTAHSDIRNSITSLSNSVTAIQNVIPSAATVNNKLTDKDYVDDSINSVTAYYITKNAQGDPFSTKAELNSATVFYSGGQVRVPTRNDYCIVEADESKQDPITGEDPTTRYIYNNGWEFQYIVNKTALTADQLAALNSGITASDVSKLSGIEAGAEVNVQSDWTEADNTSDAYIKNKPTIGNATLTVTQNGTSVGTFTANATSDVTLALTDTLYNDFTGATSGTAGAHGLVIAPAAGDQMKALYGDGTWKLAHMTIAAYGKSTYAEILAAYQANNIIYCRASSNSNPGTGNQLRMAFLAYVNNEATPTEFEFQYYRSVATHTDTQQGDQVYVYKINSAGTWSVTVREAYTKVKAGTNMTSSYSSGTITLNATDTTYSDFTGATSGTAGAHGLVPAPAAGDEDKFLKGDGSWDGITIPTKTSDLSNDGSDGTSTYVEADELATVATTGNYSDLSGTPAIPTLYSTLGQNVDGALTQKVSTDYFNDAAYIGNGTVGTPSPWVTTADIVDGAVTAGKLYDLSTANTTDTWVPVINGSKIQHRIIKTFNADGSVPSSALDWASIRQSRSGGYTGATGNKYCHIMRIQVTGAWKTATARFTFASTQSSTFAYDVLFQVRHTDAAAEAILNATSLRTTSHDLASRMKAVITSTDTVDLYWYTDSGGSGMADVYSFDTLNQTESNKGVLTLYRDELVDSLPAGTQVACTVKAY